MGRKNPTRFATSYALACGTSCHSSVLNGACTKAPCSATLDPNRWRNALSEMKEVARIVDSLDALQPRQVGTVVGVLPLHQVGIDIVLVCGPTGVWTHLLPH